MRLDHLFCKTDLRTSHDIPKKTAETGIKYLMTISAVINNKMGQYGDNLLCQNCQ